MDEDPLQSRIYFLTFIDSLDMIFSQYRGTCEVLLDYPKIGGDYVSHSHQTNQNHRSKMGRTSHLSDAYNSFSSSCASFSLLLSLMTMTPTNQMTTVQGPGPLLVRDF